MLTYVLALSHGALAALLLAGWRLPPPAKRALTLGASVIGMAAGGITFALHSSEESWRTLSFNGSATAVAAGAVVCAWLVVGVLDLGEHRYSCAAFTGIAATGVSMFASSGWSVPALLFWSAATVAIVALIVRRDGRERALPVAVLLLSDALLVGALTWHALDQDSWALPAPAAGGPFWLAVGAALTRAVVVPGVGPGGLAGSGAAPALPLVAGGGAVIAGHVAGRSEPWLAVALLVLSTAIATRGVLARGVRLGVLAAWPAALGMAAIYVGPDAIGVGGLAVVIAATMHALWHDRHAIVSIESAAALALVPTTVGFAAVAATASAAFFRTDLADSALDKAPWVGVASLLPIALSASIACAARLARSAGGRTDSQPLTAWAVRGLLVASLVAGGAATTTGELGAPSAPELWLLIVAALAAIAAAAGVLRTRRPGSESAASVAEGAIKIAIEGLHPPRLVLLAATPAMVVFGGGSLVALAYVTVEGLRQGFL